MEKDIFQNWTREQGRLLNASFTDEQHPTVPVTDAYDHAVETFDLETTSKGMYVLPLFEPDGPKLTQEYIIYNPETREVKYYDSQKRRINWMSPSKVATTRLGKRLRWWLPDEKQQIETLDDDQLPPENVVPVTTLTDTEVNEFFGEMRELVREEREADEERSRERYEELGFDTALNRGLMAGPFIPVGTDLYENDRAYKFQLVTEEDADDDTEPNLRDDAGVFPENRYIVGAREHQSLTSIEMEAVYVGDTELWLRPVNKTLTSNSSLDNALTDVEATVWLHDLLNPLPYDRRLNAIREVESNRQKWQLLSGNRNVTFSSNKYAVPDSDIELNDSQEKALIWAEAANDCLCIHGPPGTGKTRTLTSYVREAVAQNERVLITAHSNQAVDNLLVGDSTVDEPEEDTIHAMVQDDSTDIIVARSGKNSENRVVTNHYQGASPGSADVVAATTSGAANFSSDSFDIGIIDEATQASRAATAIAFNVSEKLILAGDHKQLPPFTASDEKLGEEQRLSLFETLMNRYGDDIAVMLQTQYRMNETIASFPNQTFYDGKLETADQNRDWKIDDLSPLMGVHIKGSEQKRGGSHSYYNPDEAEAAAKQVKLLANSGLSPSDIGVIAAYRGQVKEIKQYLQKLDITRIHQVTVDTVDAFQGSEREAIIVSLVRSNSRGSSGFLTMPDEGPRRLNVALTRGRKRLVIIGDWDTLSKCGAHRDPDESCSQLYGNLEASIRGIEKMLEIEGQSAQ